MFPVYFVIIIGLVILFCFLFGCLFIKAREKEMAWSWVDGKVGSLLEESGKGKRMIRMYFMKKFSKNKLVRLVGDGTRL